MKSTLLFLLLLVIAAVGCTEEESFNFRPKVVLAIDEMEDVHISDSIFFITKDTSAHEVTILAGPSDGTLFYSSNGRDYTTSEAPSIHLNQEDSILQFYFTKEGLGKSILYTVIFTDHAKKFLDRGQAYPNPFDSLTHLKFADKSRGELEVELFNMQGRRLAEYEFVKKTDTLQADLDLHKFKSGLYLYRVRYGDDSRIFRLVKDGKR